MQLMRVLLLIAGWALAQVAGAATVYELSDDAGVVGAAQVISARYEDTLVDIGRVHRVGFEELRLANPEVDPWLPGEGTAVTLPTAFVLPSAERSGIVINIAEYRVYVYFRDGGRDYVATLPASIGRMDWETPLGLTRIVAKAARPAWYPPQSVRDEWAAEGRELPRVVPPGPDNPLGEYALRLGLPGYLIHGTNRPAGVGMRVTHGCVRLFPEDIRWLYPRARVDMPVRIVNQPIKFGWQGDELFLEVHPELTNGAEAVDAAAAEPVVASMTSVTEAYIRATADTQAEVDWDLVSRTFAKQTGIPVRVGKRVIDPGLGARQVAAEP